MWFSLSRPLFLDPLQSGRDQNRAVMKGAALWTISHSFTDLKHTATWQPITLSLLLYFRSVTIKSNGSILMLARPNMFSDKFAHKASNYHQLFHVTKKLKMTHDEEKNVKCCIFYDILHLFEHKAVLSNFHGCDFNPGAVLCFVCWCKPCITSQHNHHVQGRKYKFLQHHIRPQAKTRRKL